MPNNGICINCASNEARWRCLECFGRPSYCSACCRHTHARLPFHRMESWTGSFFKPSWLRHVGVCLHLGHGGEPCPTIIEEDRQSRLLMGNLDSYQSSGTPTPRWTSQDDPSLLTDPYPRQGDIDINGRQLIIVVDISGIHHIGIEFCRCPTALPRDTQLISLGLFPATFDNPQTVFSFRVLDDFLLDNLECKTTALNYYSKLRRVTNSSFPHLVPVSQCSLSLCFPMRPYGSAGWELIENGMDPVLQSHPVPQSWAGIR
jgi:CxC2 like cysteine cluster associated with KDZ transposases